MKKAITLVALLSLTSIGWAGTSREATNDRLDHAGRVLHEIMAAPDKGIPEEVLEHAKCVAVVPHLLKGGFVFGAENGRGVATCRTPDGWSAPVFLVIPGGAGWAAAGPVGRDASADTDCKMDAENLTYWRATGAFAGLTRNGAL